MVIKLGLIGVGVYFLYLASGVMLGVSPVLGVLFIAFLVLSALKA